MNPLVWFTLIFLVFTPIFTVLYWGTTGFAKDMLRLSALVAVVIVGSGTLLFAVLGAFMEYGVPS